MKSLFLNQQYNLEERIISLLSRTFATAKDRKCMNSSSHRNPPLIRAYQSCVSIDTSVVYRKNFVVKLIYRDARPLLNI